MRPAILAYIDPLDTKIQTHHRSILGRHGETTNTVCREIMATAPGYGFPTVAEAAEKVLQLSLDDQDGEDLDDPCACFNELAALCAATHIDAKIDTDGS